MSENAFHARSLEAAHLIVTGTVQGVAFRYFTRRMAQDLGLAGWVRNLPDGRVEALFQGSRSLLEEAIAWCQEGPPAARVDSVEVEWPTPDDSVEGFRITG
jgi:acylphosphatase